MFARGPGKIRGRKRKGYCVAELAASFVFMIPLLFVLLYAVVELVKAYMINTVLAQASTQAARQLSVLYPSMPTQIQTRSYQNSLVYGNITYTGIVANQAQFDDAIFNTTADPPTVRVTVHYLGGQYGLQSFPSYDPLGLGSQFNLSGSAVYKLEGY